MSDAPFLVPNMPKPADPSAHKPAYLVKVEDPTVKDNIRYFLSRKIQRNPLYVSLEGCELKQAEVKKVVKEPNATVGADKPVSIDLPWQKVISIQNISYRQKQ